jgi:hypothetical protein
MGLFDKLFGKSATNTTAQPIPGRAPAPGNEPISPQQPGAPYEGLNDIRFGRYNDNNKSYAQTQKWRLSEDLFKEKKYNDSIAAFFEYIANEQEQNIQFTRDGERFRFELMQGSRKVYGESDGKSMVAHAPVALMETPGVAVMRRLLDLNYLLYYSRCAMNNDNELCIILDFPIPMASPSKLYYGLRELATRADRLDDQLIADFARLKPANDEHIRQIPDKELDVKYAYFRRWTEETLKLTADLNPDSFSGAIAYLMLTLLYRIDFLMVPEGGLMTELERISAIYWSKKDEVPLIERNKLMKDAILKLLEMPKETFKAGMYRTTATFAVASPVPPDKLRENLFSANRDAAWYMENKYPEIAQVLNEYGLVYNQYAYSIPLVLKDLGTIYMAVTHAGFFAELGMQQSFYNPDTKTFNRTLIEQAVNEAISFLPDKYEHLNWDHSKVQYDSLYDFGISFTNQMANLNLEPKK